MDPTIGQGFNQDIAYRYRPGQTQAEFYSQKSGQTFGGADQLASYINSNYQGANASADNVFGVLAGGFTPRAQALDQIKTDLNSFQQNAFNSTDTNKRASSSLSDSIKTQQDDLAKYLSEYNDLRTKLQNVAAPNYQEAYGQLRQQAGVPEFENQYAQLSQQRRELPYVERANTGNAGIATEGQLADQTAQKDIPLYIQQANALDRLKLAQDFISTSLNLKELDHNASRSALTDAATLLGQTMDFTRTNLTDLQQRQQHEQELALAAQNFAIESGIDQPLYQVGNTIYDTATRTPKYVNNGGTFSTVDGSEVFASPEQFFKHSGVNSFDQIYHINSTTMADKNAVLDLRQKYPDAGITAKDSFETASAKLQNSRIYGEQVRPPANSSNSGGMTIPGIGNLTNQQIDNINPLVASFQSSPIVQNYNVIGEGNAFAQSLNVNTSNPADDQALIYAFAKAMDPNSVVREGEYATVQKYAQSWADSYGFSAKRVFSNTNFLTPKARENMKSTIEQRFKASQQSYNNLFNETSRRINLVGGIQGGDKFLNNYGGAYTQPSQVVAGPPSPPPAQQTNQASGGFINKAINWLFGK